MQNDTTLKLLLSRSNDNFVLGAMGCQGLKYIEESPPIRGGIKRWIFRSCNNDSDFSCDRLVIADYEERAIAWFSSNCRYTLTHHLTHDQAMMIVNHLKEQVSE